MATLGQLLKPVLVPIHRAGWPFVAAFAVGSLLLGWLWGPLLLPGAVLTLWCVYFFRDPHRVTPARPGLVVAPADGIVERITHTDPPEELELPTEPRTRISIFMNVFDVHVNRSPVDGKVVRIAYRPGLFLNASLDKASQDNERNAISLKLPDGRKMVVVQIAGLVARRILCDLREGQPLSAGQRLGMIRFGSRVDVYLPDGVAPLVCEGQRTIAGETVLADLEPQRHAGEARGPGRRGEYR